MTSETSAMQLRPDLGTLSTLPLELRNQIYTYVLDPRNWVTKKQFGQRKRIGRTTLLRTSKAIFEEAIIALITVTNFRICVERKYNRNVAQCFRTERLGWSYRLEPGWFIDTSRNGRVLSEQQQSALERRGLFQMLRFVTVQIGRSGRGSVEESDICPLENAAKSTKGISLMSILSQIVEGLRGSALKELRVHITCARTSPPPNLSLMLDTFQRLRGVGRCQINDLDHYRGLGWKLKQEYIQYFQKVMQLPIGVEIPAWTASHGENFIEFYDVPHDEDDEDDNSWGA